MQRTTTACSSVDIAVPSFATSDQSVDPFCYLSSRLPLASHLKAMTGFAKNSVQLVGVGLFIYLVFKLVVAVNKLQDEKVATLTTRKYENSRLFPSMSICFRRKINGNLSDNPGHALNISRQVKLVSFTLILILVEISSM